MPELSCFPPNHLLIKVHAAASNPKDHLHLHGPFNSGDDLSGTVVGLTSTTEADRLKIGDRVAAFHQMSTAYGAYAEYAVAPAWTTVKIPDEMVWEEAATLPLVLGTAGLTLFRRLGFCAPWEESAIKENGGKALLVYGASGALGTAVVKLAKLSGLRVIAVGGRSSGYVKGLLGKEDFFVDRANGMTAIMEELEVAVKERGWNISHAVDCVSEEESWIGVSYMMNAGKLSVVSGKNRYDDPCINPDVKVVYTYVGSLHTGKYLPAMPKQPSEQEAKDDTEFARTFYEWVELMLVEGKLEGHPYETVSGGLEGVVDGLNRLKAGDARGRKFVYRIAA